MRELVSQGPWRDQFVTKFSDGLVVRTARIPKSAPTTARGVLRRAANIIDRKGLARGKMRDENGCRCLYAALLEGAGLGYDLDRALDAGHIDARQIKMNAGSMARFDVLREALDLLGIPEAWGSTLAIAPLARYSDRTDQRRIVNLLRAASYGVRPTWERRDSDELALR